MAALPPQVLANDERATSPATQRMGSMKGWLYKHSGGHRGGGLRGLMGNMKDSWDRRFFVLDNRTMNYFKTEAGAAFGQSLGSFDCRGAALEERDDGAFVLTSHNRELRLRLSEADGDAREWIAALQVTCETYSRKQERVAGEVKAKRGAAQAAEAEAAQQAGAAFARRMSQDAAAPAAARALAPAPALAAVEDEAHRNRVVDEADETSGVAQSEGAAKEQAPARGYVVVDEEDTAKQQVPVEDGDAAEKYWEHVSASATPEVAPRLVITFGTPGAGKSRVLQHFLRERGWAAEEFVHLDPDVLRYYSKEYRLCLSGAHAARLDSVKARFGAQLRPAQWESPVGGFAEEGMQADGQWLALAHAGLRSTPVVRQHMLWGKPTKLADGTTAPCPIGDGFVDRALSRGLPVIYGARRESNPRSCRARATHHRLCLQQTRTASSPTSSSRS